MTHEVVLTKEAEMFLEKLDNSTRKRVINKLEQLKENPQLGKPLTACLAGSWSLRIGDYRAIYQIKHNELIVVVIRIGYRRNVYY